MAIELGPECVFLIPLVRDSDRRPHQPIVWDLLRNALRREFEAFHFDVATVPGEWISSDDPGNVVEDQCRKFTVAIPQDRVDELRRVLRRAGNSFDQREVYLAVAGYAELLKVKPEDGFSEI